MKIRKQRKGGQYTIESWMMANGKLGEVFYSEKMDRHLTAIATHHKRKIQTERLVAVTTGKEDVRAIAIVRVTLMSEPFLVLKKPKSVGQKRTKTNSH